MTMAQEQAVWDQNHGKEGILFHGGRVLCPDGLKAADVLVRDGLIESLDPGRTVPTSGVDLAGDILLPGLIELHTDNLEKHIMPRPGIYWKDPLGALEAHDAQVASSGITTVFDSICVGESVDLGREAMLRISLEAFLAGKGSLRARHLLHIRCEISSAGMARQLGEALGLAKPNLASIMDHTPWQRQWRSLADWARYNRKKSSLEEQEREAIQIKEVRDKHAEGNTRLITAYAKANGIPIATHDDTEPAHIEEALAHGAVISEFPTTLEAAAEAYKAGLTVIMGAPNLLRGSSHSGNVLASDVAKAGHLSCLSSDYVPSSLLHGAFALWLKHGYSFEDAMATVTRNPAKAAGLDDRGAIDIGMKADLVRVSLLNRRPRVEGVWVGGNRVY
jgi:alpha-D-ribose 1-methylphosphonate 5-triphosphate diphosphatase